MGDSAQRLRRRVPPAIGVHHASPGRHRHQAWQVFEPNCISTMLQTAEYMTLVRRATSPRLPDVITAEISQRQAPSQALLDSDNGHDFLFFLSEYAVSRTGADRETAPTCMAGHHGHEMSRKLRRSSERAENQSDHVRRSRTGR